MKHHVYFIPGMFANSKIFERIHLPKSKYECHYLEWLLPISKKETLDSYVNRFSQQIKHSNPIFIGVSFGGIIAQELVNKFRGSKVILISSIKHQNEFQPSFHFFRKTKLYHLFPIAFFNFIEPYVYSIGSKKIKKQLLLYRKYLTMRGALYTHWALHNFLNWEQNSPKETLHLHGGCDLILPFKYVKNGIEIQNGTHAMVLSKAHTLQTQILNYLALFFVFYMKIIL